MRALKIATIVMGVLIVLGTMSLLVLVARRSAGPSSPPASGLSAVLQEPQGTHIAGMTAWQDRLAVRLQGGGPDRIVVLDPRSGLVVGHVTLSQQEPAPAR